MLAGPRVAPAQESLGAGGWRRWCWPFIVVSFGVNATNALVISQVVLNIALPFPMIALVMFTRRCGSFVNRRLTNFVVIITGTVAVLFLSVC